MSKKTILALSQRTIAYHPIYRKITGSTTSAILLSQIMYWYVKVEREFYKTDEEIMDETLLTENELRGAKKKISELPFVKMELKGIPAKTHYDIDLDLLEAAIEANDIRPNKIREIHGTGDVKSTKLTYSTKKTQDNQEDFFEKKNKEVTDLIQSAELSKKDMADLRKVIKKDLQQGEKDGKFDLQGMGATGLADQIADYMIATGWEIRFFRRGMVTTVSGSAEFVANWVKENIEGDGQLVADSESKSQPPFIRLMMNRLDEDDLGKRKYLRKYWINRTHGEGESTIRYHCFIASGHRKISLFELERIAALHDQRELYYTKHRTGPRGFWNDEFLETIIEPLS